VASRSKLRARAPRHPCSGYLIDGKFAEAEAEYRKGLAVDRKLLDDNPGVPAFRAYGTSWNLGLLLWEMGKESEAEAVFREAIPVSQKLVDDIPASTEYRYFLAHSYYVLGSFLVITGRPSEGEAVDRKGLAVLQKLADDDPKVIHYSQDHLLTVASQNPCAILSPNVCEYPPGSEWEWTDPVGDFALENGCKSA